ncbi:hypothetical protein [Streptomyces tendae]|uniref:hypothetical protein n=1 Tax=Streptomyces tendae TaxID=1932 RepID=UPI003655A3E4
MTRTVAGTATGKVAVLSDIHGMSGPLDQEVVLVDSRIERRQEVFENAPPCPTSNNGSTTTPGGRAATARSAKAAA